MKFILLLSTLLFSCSLYASIDTWQFASLEQEHQYRELTQQLRCPKCQNNNIADSNAIIAADMRAKVYELTQQGYTRQNIIDYMVARYGHFVTYQPPLTAVILLLWIAPVFFLLIGLAIIIRQARLNSIENTCTKQEQQRQASLQMHNFSKIQSLKENNSLHLSDKKGNSARRMTYRKSSS